MNLNKIKNSAKAGFTLIELLVVITIIGILATGATATYTSQIQKARDTTRITDITAMQWGLEQAFQDLMAYPGVALDTVASLDCSWADEGNTNIQCIVELGFLNKLPQDPKSGQPANGSALDYTYNVWPKDGVTRQVYEISTWVESDWIKTSKAANIKDGWNDNNRIELWADIQNIHTCTAADWVSCSSGDSITWRTTIDSCHSIDGTVSASTSSSQWQAVFVKWNCL